MDEAATKPVSRTILQASAVGLLAILCYLPSLRCPIDFEDDGARLPNMAAEETLAQRWERTWFGSLEEARFIGPFRPVYHAYYEFQSYLFGTRIEAWRLTRLAILGLSAGLFYVLLRDLGIPGWPAGIMVLISVTAPLRSSIWYRLAFGEGQAMVLVLIALLAARAASRSRYGWCWDGVGILCVLAAILTKNVFVAVVPAQMLLRVWADGESLWAGIKRRWPVALLISSTVALPIGHVIYFKTQVDGASDYEVIAPGLTQLLDMVRGVGLAAGWDFLAVSFVITLLAVLCSKRARSLLFDEHRRVVLAGALLLSAGVIVYLPALMGRSPAGRYTIPAVWGWDLIGAALLSATAGIGVVSLRRLAGATLGIGLAVMVGLNVYQQVEFTCRCQTLWETARWLRDHAPTECQVGLGDRSMSAAEAQHLQGALEGLGRSDVTILPSETTLETALDQHVDVMLHRVGAEVPEGPVLTKVIDHSRLIKEVFPARMARRRRWGGIAIESQAVSSRTAAANGGEDAPR
ncbi:hypothetical protein Pan216_57400 [Planctomycetes bacterium Pan216]|uniref:Glycosyltransferase RgtA/B/C/D-like domain-containing protein n=1 Tax=Kolteria novifilia TaxID=2527975 RepID=A0A518BD04_9BACT|nr:hypothetical protein Pan216_57400 [Planctomycetes bacterium Pan216]